MKRRSRQRLPVVRKDGKPVLIFDATALSYNAFYAIGTALSYNGQPTTVIYGFLRAILSAGLKFKTDQMYFCWDAGRTYRHFHYAGYKNGRKKKRDEYSPEEQEEYNQLLYQQVKLHHNVLPRLGLKNTFCFDYYEGDDLIAQLVRKHFKGHRKIIFTSDNDLYQLLDESDIFLLHSKKLFTHEHFKEKYGIHADQWPLAKAIGGCNGDSIIGVKGCADPKSPTSNALKYIRGELPRKGTIFKRIKEQENSRIAHNLLMVTTPYLGEQMPKFQFRKNRVTRRRLIKQFDRFRFISFLESEMFTKWEKVFCK